MTLTILKYQGQQAITDWRRRFLLKAAEAVRIEVMKCGDKHARAAFATAAVNKSGVAFWESCDIKDVRT